MPLKILATSDIHLGRRSTWLPEKTPEASVKYVWNRMIDLALEEKADVLAITGDIVDQYNSYFEASGPLQEGFSRLKDAAVDVFVVSGNHDFDVLAQLLSHNPFPNVHLLGKGGQWERHTLHRKGMKVDFLGWSFPSRFVHIDPMNELRQIDKTNPTIGLLHGDVDVAGSIYAPISLHALQSAPAEAWIIGHIHKHEVYSRQPLIFYPGSPQALSPKETGEHGVVMLNIEDYGEINWEFIPISPVRYESIRVDVSRAIDQESFMGIVNAAISKPPPNFLTTVVHLLMDVELSGHSTVSHRIDAWMQEIINFESSRDGCSIRVRKVINRVRPFIDLENLARDPSPAGKLAETILAIEKGQSTEFLDNLTRDWLDKAAQTRTSSTYNVLSAAIPEATEEHAIQFILDECRQLLAHLLETREAKS